MTTILGDIDRVWLSSVVFANDDGGFFHCVIMVQADTIEGAWVLMEANLCNYSKTSISKPVTLERLSESKVSLW